MIIQIDYQNVILLRTLNSVICEVISFTPSVSLPCGDALQNTNISCHQHPNVTEHHHHSLIHCFTSRPPSLSTSVNNGNVLLHSSSDSPKLSLFARLTLITIRMLFCRILTSSFSFLYFSINY